MTMPTQGNLQDRAVIVDKLVHNSSENMTIFRKRDREWYERYKKDEQEKKTDARDSLSPAKLPSWYGNKHLAHIYHVLEPPEVPQPGDDLRALARYVKLTILHDTKLPFQPVNDGIWLDDEPFVQDMRRHLANQPEPIAEIDSDLASVKADLQAETKPDSARVQPITVIQNIKNTLGIFRGGHLQAGDHTSITSQAEPEKKKKGILRRLWWIIAAVVGFIASVLGILEHLGWFE